MADAFACPNCETINKIGSNFCNHCSQKSTLKLNSVWRMFVDFFAYIIDYDSKLFASIRGLSNPGFLTTQYFAKKQIRYLTPMRLFVYLMIVFFAILSFTGLDDFKLNIMGDDKSDSKSLVVDQGFDESNYNFLEKFSPKMRIISLVDSLVIELERQKFDQEKSKQDNTEGVDEAELIKIQKHLDLLSLTIDKLKSLKKSSNYNENETFDIVVYKNKYKVNIADINTLSADQLIEKYKVNSWLDKLFVKQFIKFNKDANGFAKFIFQNLTWVIILDVLLMSLVFKLFYFRTKKLYVEHFIFHLHVRSFMFIVGIILLLISLQTIFPLKPNFWVYFLTFITLSLYVLAANFNVYKQSKFLTIIKLIFLGLIELILLNLSLVFVISVSGFLF